MSQQQKTAVQMSVYFRLRGWRRGVVRAPMEAPCYEEGGVGAARRRERAPDVSREEAGRQLVGAEEEDGEDDSVHKSAQPVAASLAVDHVPNLRRHQPARDGEDRRALLTYRGTPELKPVKQVVRTRVYLRHYAGIPLLRL